MNTPKLSRNTSGAKWCTRLVLSTSLTDLLGPLLVTMSGFIWKHRVTPVPFSFQACDPAVGARVKFCKFGNEARGASLTGDKGARTAAGEVGGAAPGAKRSIPLAPPKPHLASTCLFSIYWASAAGIRDDRDAVPAGCHPFNKPRRRAESSPNWEPVCGLWRHLRELGSGRRQRFSGVRNLQDRVNLLRN